MVSEEGKWSQRWLCLRRAMVSSSVTIDTCSYLVLIKIIIVLLFRRE